MINETSFQSHVILFQCIFIAAAAAETYSHIHTLRSGGARLGQWEAGLRRGRGSAAGTGGRSAGGSRGGGAGPPAERRGGGPTSPAAPRGPAAGPAGPPRGPPPRSGTHVNNMLIHVDDTLIHVDNMLIHVDNTLVLMSCCRARSCYI